MALTEEDNLCTKTAPGGLVWGEDLCWLPRGHEDPWHKTLRESGYGYRIWVEWLEIDEQW